MPFLFYLKTSNTFEAYSIEHFAPILITAFIGIVLIRIAMRSQDSTQRLIGMLIGLIPFLSVTARMIYLLIVGEFTIQGDLPLHLCRLIALLAPFVMYYKWRMWLGIFYFWIFIGTLGANILPDLDDGFPSLDYFLFWFLHSILVILPFYIVFVYRVKIQLKDLVITFIATNLFLLIWWFLNLSIGSNYFYTMEKPNTGGLLDFLGEYPFFLLYGQLLILGFLLVFYLPFALSSKGLDIKN